MPEEETFQQCFKRQTWAVEPASSTPRQTSQGYRGGCAGGRTSISLPGHENSHSHAPGQWLFPPVLRIALQRFCGAVCTCVCGARGGTRVRPHRICTFPSLFWCTWSREAPAAIHRAADWRLRLACPRHPGNLGDRVSLGFPDPSWKTQVSPLTAQGSSWWAFADRKSHF